MVKFMNNKKTIIFGIVAVIFLIGIVWFAGEYGQGLTNQAASVLGGGKEQSSEVILGEEFFLGAPDAPVTITEYSSYFCGYCADFHKDTLPLIMDEYIKSGKVKFISRLLSPPELSMAVLCAQDQGKFQEFNGELFRNIENIGSVEELRAVATTLGLSQEEFNACFDSNKHQVAAEKWFEQAQEAGVEGTPTFFVNDQQIVGNQPYSVFQNAIEAALGE